MLRIISVRNLAVAELLCGINMGWVSTSGLEIEIIGSHSVSFNETEATKSSKI